MEYFVISAKFVPLKYYTLSSQLQRLTSFSVGCSGRRILSPGQIAVMRKWSIQMQIFSLLLLNKEITCFVGYILKSVFASSNSFCLITSQLLYWLFKFLVLVRKYERSLCGKCLSQWKITLNNCKWRIHILGNLTKETWYILCPHANNTISYNATPVLEHIFVGCKICCNQTTDPMKPTNLFCFFFPFK